MKMEWKWKPLSCDQLFVTPWAIQSMEFPRPEYWNGQLFPSPEDLSNPRTEPRSPALQADSLPAEPSGNPMKMEGKSNFPPRTKELWFFLLMLVYFRTRDLLFSSLTFPISSPVVFSPKTYGSWSWWVSALIPDPVILHFRNEFRLKTTGEERGNVRELKRRSRVRK